MTKPQLCGLFAAERAVPLVGVRIDAKAIGPTVEVIVSQRYRNDETVPVEAVYVFPREEGAAVCGFAANVGGRRIEARIATVEQKLETK